MMEKEINITIKIKWLMPIVFIIIAMALTWKLWISNRGEPPQTIQKKTSNTSRKIFLSKDILTNYDFLTTQLETKAESEEIILPGKVSYDLENLAEVSARMDGRIVRVYVKEGDNLKAGMPLASITSVELGMQAEKFLKAKAKLETAKLQSERAKELFNQKIIPAKEYEKAYTQFKTIKTEVETGKNSLMIYGFTAKQIDLISQGKLNYKNIILWTPISGTVTYRNAVMGKSISSGDKLFVVANLSKLWILLNVYEKDLASVEINSKAIIYPLADKTKIIKAKVAHVGSVVDPQSHTATIRLEVRNKDRKLKPGQTVSAKVFGLVSNLQTKKISVLPGKAIHTVEGKNIVFVKNSDNSFEAREVEIGRTVNNDIEIISGISGKDNVVIENSFVLKSEYLK